MGVHIYRTSGELVRGIPEDVASAQEYLTADDMTQYLDDGLEKVVKHIEWKLEGDGLNWSVTAITKRKLKKPERKQLSEWISGQNSDGLGEGFEQQDFAWSSEDCGECDGCNDGYSCDDEGGSMCSFDWKTNKCKLVLIK